VNEADDGAFERTMLAAASDLVACDTVSYNEHHLDRGEELACVVEPSYLERSPTRRHYLRHLGHHPPVAACASGRLVTGDCASLSDLMTPGEFRNLPIYTDYFRHRELADQLVAVLTARDARTDRSGARHRRLPRHRRHRPAHRPYARHQPAHRRQAPGERLPEGERLRTGGAGGRAGRDAQRRRRRVGGNATPPQNR